MAATMSSVWAKPGAWALDSEEHEDELKQEIRQSQPNPIPEPPASDFPSLAAASATKAGKKKKGQTFSLAEFNTGAPKQTYQQSHRLTHDELIVLPTGPRERTAEELDRSRLGGGFRNYGGGYGGSDSGRSRASERGGGYNGNSSGERDSSLSRADEVDDWSKTKKGFSGDFDRRDKGGFFNSSRADESDNWASNKSYSPSEGRRDRRPGMGFDSFSNGGGADSENWGKKKEETFESKKFDRVGSGFDRERRGGGGFESSGAADLGHWGKKKEEKDNGMGVSLGGGRPRLNLQPRTLPVNTSEQQQLGMTEAAKPKSANPFGEARPREQVLAEKGKDWKEIEEKLDAMKVSGEKAEGSPDGFRRRGFGIGRQDSGDDKTERSWRKDSNDTRPSSAEKTDEEVLPEEN